MIDALIIIIAYSHDMGLLNMLVRVLIALTAIMNIMRVVRQGATLRIPKWDDDERSSHHRINHGIN